MKLSFLLILMHNGLQLKDNMENRLNLRRCAVSDKVTEFRLKRLA